jgi:hypothetical protein
MAAPIEVQVLIGLSQIRFDWKWVDERFRLSAPTDKLHFNQVLLIFQISTAQSRN